MDEGVTCHGPCRGVDSRTQFGWRAARAEVKQKWTCLAASSWESVMPCRKPLQGRCCRFCLGSWRGPRVSPGLQRHQQVRPVFSFSKRTGGDTAMRVRLKPPLRCLKRPRRNNPANKHLANASRKRILTSRKCPLDVSKETEFACENISMICAFWKTCPFYTAFPPVFYSVSGGFSRPFRPIGESPRCRSIA